MDIGLQGMPIPCFTLLFSYLNLVYKITRSG
jgi:hypothetical protein